MDDTQLDLDSLMGTASSLGMKVFFEYSAFDILLNLLVATISGFIISSVYRKNHSGLSYSAGFTKTIVYVAVLTCLVMMIIGGSVARAFALVGAMSIIRFRTVLKDPLDLSFVFGSLVFGMAAGTSNHLLVIVGLPAFGILVFMMNKNGFFYDQALRDLVLSFTGDERLTQPGPRSEYITILADKTKFNKLASVSQSSSDDVVVVYHIEVAENSSEASLVGSISAVQGVIDVHVLRSGEQFEH